MSAYDAISNTKKQIYELFPGYSSKNHPFSNDKVRMFSIPEAAAVMSDGTQTSPDSRLDKIRREAEFMAHDLISTFGKENPPKAPNKYCATLRRTVNEMSSKHDRVFKGIGNKLKPEESDALQTFVIIGDEIFEGGQVNWGRIVAVYAFAAHLANYLTDDADSVDSGSTNNNLVSKSEPLKEKIAVFVGQYVANKLGKWILDNGGWDAFVEYFPEQGEFEAKLKKGILFTTLGLGALATLFAIR